MASVRDYKDKVEDLLTLWWPFLKSGIMDRSNMQLLHSTSILIGSVKLETTWSTRFLQVSTLLPTLPIDGPNMDPPKEGFEVAISEAISSPASLHFAVDE